MGCMAVWFVFPGRLYADATGSTCSGEPTTLLSRVLAQHPEVQKARSELEIIAGRKVSAGVWLPSHPVVTLAATYRRNEVQQDYNLYATLSQELRIGGQRAARLAQADAEAMTQLKRLYVVEQEVAAQLFQAYFDHLNALEEAQLAGPLEALAKNLADFAQRRAQNQLISDVDMRLVQADAIRLKRLNIGIQRRLKTTRAVLNVFLGCDSESSPAQFVPLALKPLENRPLSEYLQQALLIRGEVQVAQAEQALADKTIARLKRERIPNLTLSIMAQRDGFAELVVGGQLSIPLFLPTPVGPSLAGEIKEAQGRRTQAVINLEVVKRQIRLEVLRAYENYQSRKDEAELMSEVFSQKLKQDLENIHKNLVGQALPVREALLMQRNIVEQLQEHVRAQLAYALATVELSRASGQDLRGLTP